MHQSPGNSRNPTVKIPLSCKLLKHWSPSHLSYRVRMRLNRRPRTLKTFSNTANQTGTFPPVDMKSLRATPEAPVTKKLKITRPTLTLTTQSISTHWVAVLGTNRQQKSAKACYFKLIINIIGSMQL